MEEFKGLLTHINSNLGFINFFLSDTSSVRSIPELKDYATKKISPKSSSSLKNSMGPPQISEPDLGAFVIRPVGYLESCFREKFGTPRQSGFVKNAKARLTISSQLGDDCLDGLEEFSYIWLIFVFHQGMNDYNPLKSKITPPKADGKHM